MVERRRGCWIDLTWCAGGRDGGEVARSISHYVQVVEMVVSFWIDLTWCAGGRDGGEVAGWMSHGVQVVVVVGEIAGWISHAGGSDGGE